MDFLRDASDFHFAWPLALWLLLLIPAGWMLYLRQLRQRLQATALAFSYAAVAAQIKQQPALWKRLLKPIATSLLAACLIIGLARPEVVAKVPVNSVDMMIVLDISLSMMADDIHPDRITAAREAAVRFVESLPRDVRVGLEVFAGDNFVLSPPTREHGQVAAYLHQLRKEDLKPRTEIGSALHTAMQVLTGTGNTAALDQAKRQAKKQEGNLPAAPSGGKKPDQVIVLLSDGDSHEGYPWDQAAREARQANITVDTVGIGSPQGGVIEYQGMQLPVSFDESTLRGVAELGDGSYFRVFSENDFQKIYDQIHARTIHYEQQTVDLGFILAGVGLAVLAVALLLMLWAL